MARSTSQDYAARRRRGETSARWHERQARAAWADDDEFRAYAHLEQADSIRTLASQTKLGRNPSTADKSNAKAAAQELDRLVGRGTGRRMTNAEREDRFFRESLRQERLGGDSWLFRGNAEATSAEAIFYAATQDLWAGRYADRDEAIKEGLGVETLEEAYAMVLAKNQEAMEAAAAGGDIAGGTRPGSDIWIMYVRFVG